jgi:hypothetical protein
MSSLVFQVLRCVVLSCAVQPSYVEGRFKIAEKLGRNKRSAAAAALEPWLSQGVLPAVKEATVRTLVAAGVMPSKPQQQRPAPAADKAAKRTWRNVQQLAAKQGSDPRWPSLQQSHAAACTETTVALLRDMLQQAETRALEQTEEALVLFRGLKASMAAAVSGFQGTGISVDQAGEDHAALAQSIYEAGQAAQAVFKQARQWQAHIAAYEQVDELFDALAPAAAAAGAGAGAAAHAGDQGGVKQTKTGAAAQHASGSLTATEATLVAAMKELEALVATTASGPAAAATTAAAAPTSHKTPQNSPAAVAELTQKVRARVQLEAAARQAAEQVRMKQQQQQKDKAPHQKHQSVADGSAAPGNGAASIPAGQQAPVPKEAPPPPAAGNKANTDSPAAAQQSTPKQQRAKQRAAQKAKEDAEFEALLAEFADGATAAPAGGTPKKQNMNKQAAAAAAAAPPAPPKPAAAAAAAQQVANAASAANKPAALKQAELNLQLELLEKLNKHKDKQTEAELAERAAEQNVKHAEEAVLQPVAAKGPAAAKRAQLKQKLQQQVQQKQQQEREQQQQQQKQKPQAAEEDIEALLAAFADNAAAAAAPAGNNPHKKKKETAAQKEAKKREQLRLQRLQEQLQEIHSSSGSDTDTANGHQNTVLANYIGKTKADEAPGGQPAAAAPAAAAVKPAAGAGKPAEGQPAAAAAVVDAGVPQLPAQKAGKSLEALLAELAEDKAAAAPAGKKGAANKKQKKKDKAVQKEAKKQEQLRLQRLQQQQQQEMHSSSGSDTEGDTGLDEEQQLAPPARARGLAAAAAAAAPVATKSPAVSGAWVQAAALGRKKRRNVQEPQGVQLNQEAPLVEDEAWPALKPLQTQQQKAGVREQRQKANTSGGNAAAAAAAGPAAAAAAAEAGAGEWDWVWQTDLSSAPAQQDGAEPQQQQAKSRKPQQQVEDAAAAAEAKTAAAAAAGGWAWAWAEEFASSAAPEPQQDHVETRQGRRKPQQQAAAAGLAAVAEEAAWDWADEVVPAPQHLQDGAHTVTRGRTRRAQQQTVDADGANTPPAAAAAAAGEWDWVWANATYHPPEQAGDADGAAAGAGAGAGPWDSQWAGQDALADEPAGEYVDPSTKIGSEAGARARLERRRQLELLGPLADAISEQTVAQQGTAQQAADFAGSPAARPRQLPPGLEAAASPLAKVLAAKLGHAPAPGSPAAALAAVVAAAGSPAAAAGLTLNHQPSPESILPFLPPHLRVNVPAAAAAAGGADSGIADANPKRLPGQQQADEHLQARDAVGQAAAAEASRHGGFFTPTAASHKADPSLMQVRAAGSDPGYAGSPLGRGPRLCLSCGQQPSNILLMPCRHIVLCDACIDTVSCPRCGRPCEDYIKVHQA